MAAQDVFVAEQVRKAREALAAAIKAAEVAEYSAGVLAQMREARAALAHVAAALP
jgi:hypothetical protein